MRACWTRCWRRNPNERATRGERHDVEPDHSMSFNPELTSICVPAFCLPPTRRRQPGTQVIDHFFGSLATDRRRNARGVVLSGIGSERNPRSQVHSRARRNRLAQDPKTAQFDSMPSKRNRVGRCRCCICAGANRRGTCDSTPAESNCRSARDYDFGRSAAILTRSSRRCSARVGRFQSVQIEHVQRRIARRMNQNRLTSLNAYATTCATITRRRRFLYNESLIHVSGFFSATSPHFTLSGAACWRRWGERAIPHRSEFGSGLRAREKCISIGILLLELLDNRGQPAAPAAVAVWHGYQYGSSIARNRAFRSKSNAKKGGSPQRHS